MANKIILVWTDERIEELKKLWAENWAASYIAREMGTSRNSIIGKIFRLKLPKRQFIIADSVKGLRRQAIPKTSPKSEVTPPPDRAYARVQVATGAEPENRNVTLTELEFRHCREIVRKDSDAVLYCGGQRMAYTNRLGQLVYSSFCREHHNVNHQLTHGVSDYGRRVWSNRS